MSDRRLCHGTLLDSRNSHLSRGVISDSRLNGRSSIPTCTAKFARGWRISSGRCHRMVLCWADPVGNGGRGVSSALRSGGREASRWRVGGHGRISVRHLFGRATANARRGGCLGLHPCVRQVWRRWKLRTRGWRWWHRHAGLLVLRISSWLFRSEAVADGRICLTRLQYRWRLSCGGC